MCVVIYSFLYLYDIKHSKYIMQNIVYTFSSRLFLTPTQVSQGRNEEFQSIGSHYELPIAQCSERYPWKKHYVSNFLTLNGSLGPGLISSKEILAQNLFCHVRFRLRNMSVEAYFFQIVHFTSENCIFESKISK